MSRMEVLRNRKNEVSGACLASRRTECARVRLGGCGATNAPRATSTCLSSSNLARTTLPRGNWARELEELLGVARGRPDFEQNRASQVLDVHHLLIVGEAARGLSDDLAASHSDIPWAGHHCNAEPADPRIFRIDQNEVWSTAVNDLPVLRPHRRYARRTPGPTIIANRFERQR